MRKSEPFILLAAAAVLRVVSGVVRSRGDVA
jgi:hypothetical protein